MFTKPYWYMIVFALLLTGCSTQRSTGIQPAASQQAATLPIPTTSAIFPKLPPTACPITRPPEVPFTPPSPYPAVPPAIYVGQLWYGTAELWTMLAADGTWSGLPQNGNGYSQKIFWWREGYDMDAEPNPKLTVTGKRLDGQAAPLLASSATNASADFGEAMLVGVDIPTPGCWQITGHYQGFELSFVVWVIP